jgi:hypothetical protein
MNTLDLAALAQLRPLLLPVQSVPVPEAGSDWCVFIRRLSMAELKSMPESVGSDRDLAFLQMSLVSEDGLPILANAEQAGQFVAGIPFTAFSRIMNAILELSVPTEKIDPGKDLGQGTA